MKVFKRLSVFFNNLLDVPSSDPDDARRRKLLNVILVGFFILGILSALATFYVIFFTTMPTDSFKENVSLALTLVGVTVGCVVVFYINRKFSGVLASGVFLLFIMYILSSSDSYEALVDGRSLLYFTIPIVMASMLMGAPYSFLFALISTIELFILGGIGNVQPNFLAIFGFFTLALISWLSSRSLEQTLRELRVINTELDHRVEDRTRELSEALSREKVEAGRREAILNSIADGVVVFDRNGVAILANPSITNLISKPQVEIIGSGLNDLLNTEDLKAGDRGKVAALLEKSAQELSNFRVQLGKKTLSVNAAEVRDDNNRSIGTVAVLRDFTREAELEQMKNTFIAIVSHELRTPLNAILGYAEMLKEAVYGQINEKQQNASTRIMTNARRLIDIVTDLLDQAQIEAGKLKIQVMPCKPAELLDNLHSVMDKIVSDKGLGLITELDPSMPADIMGDPQRLQQIMVNLTNNAVKFTTQGTIQVKVYPYDDGKSWRIQTVDTGSGIPEEAKEYIFESFRQVEGASTRQHGGVGLGLSIVKQLVELMNGKITVESEIGKGSTFTITLPLNVNEAAAVQPQ